MLPFGGSPLIWSALHQMSGAGITDIVVVVGDNGWDLVRHLDGGYRFIYQPGAPGLLGAVAAAVSCFEGESCALVMPDTLIRPADALRQVRAFAEGEGATLGLGLFESDHPEELGAVYVGVDGQVLAHRDKQPPLQGFDLVWGCAVWSPRFNKLILEAAKATTGESDVPIGRAFDLALDRGDLVYGLAFPNGQFRDIGTYTAYVKAINER